MMKRAVQCQDSISRAMNVALAVGLVMAASVVLTQSAKAQTFKVLYEFKGSPDGASPTARLIWGPAGNLYGTTYNGGAYGFGAVFTLDPTGKETVLHSFDGSVAAFPFAGLLRDAAGNLYGTLSYNVGTIFKLDTKGKETVLHTFSGADGSSPQGDLIRDMAGNLYGTTSYGGAYDAGTVFKLDAAGGYQVLHSFSRGADGAYPIPGLRRDAIGNLYGTASAGGDSDLGTVFKLDTAANLTVLHSFSGTDGANPYGRLTHDAAGSLYGVTYYGGAYGAGTVFELDVAGSESVLHNFSGGSDGANPVGGLLRDAAGNLYGTSAHGGAYDLGTVFKLDTTGKETVLHSFSGSDGAYPYPGLLGDPSGNLYGTTNAGGAYGVGVVFKITR
jgi:uncharacterized repeat protein (TIGR03803 family)